MALEYKYFANRVCSLGLKAALMQLRFLDHAVCAHWLSKLQSSCGCLCKHHHCVFKCLSIFLTFSLALFHPLYC